MYSLLLDELSRTDLDKVQEFLTRNARSSEVEGLFWVDFHPSDLTPEQLSHATCRPHRFAVELGDGFVRLELLVRPAQGLSCTCGQYATPGQRRAIFDFADRMVAQLDLRP